MFKVSRIETSEPIGEEVSIPETSNIILVEVMALQDKYNAMNKPRQLKGWQADGGDTCEQSWMGIECSGSSGIPIKPRGLALAGNLGNQLANLHSLKNLNLSHSFLPKAIGNVFAGLQNLKDMDLSYNKFAGDLPSSFASLSDLSYQYLQNINTVSLSLSEQEHPGIVNLTGYCLERGLHLFVYEYVRGLTLEKALHGGYIMPLTWSLRIRIALGVAQALDYMHSLSPPMAHCTRKLPTYCLMTSFCLVYVIAVFPC